MIKNNKVTDFNYYLFIFLLDEILAKNYMFVECVLLKQIVQLQTMDTIPN